MDIKPGYQIKKPVMTAEECALYAEAAQTVNQHNAACTPGQTLWSIEDKGDYYEVIEDGAMEAPAPTVAQQLAALQTALEDADAMNVDQEFRLTLLELGIDAETFLI